MLGFCVSFFKSYSKEHQNRVEPYRQTKLYYHSCNKWLNLWDEWLLTEVIKWWVFRQQFHQLHFSHFKRTVSVERLNPHICFFILLLTQQPILLWLAKQQAIMFKYLCITGLNVPTRYPSDYLWVANPTLAPPHFTRLTAPCFSDTKNQTHNPSARSQTPCLSLSWPLPTCTRLCVPKFTPSTSTSCNCRQNNPKKAPLFKQFQHKKRNWEELMESINMQTTMTNPSV